MIDALLEEVLLDDLGYRVSLVEDIDECLEWLVAWLIELQNGAMSECMHRKEHPVQEWLVVLLDQFCLQSFVVREEAAGV